MSSPATPEAEGANAAAAVGLHDETEAALAERGLIAAADGVPPVRDNRRFAFLGGELNGPKAAEASFAVNWVLPEDTYLTELSNGSLHTAVGVLDHEAQATVTLERDDLIGLLLDPAAVIAKLKTEGDATVLATLFSLLDHFESDFPIVTP